MESFMVIGSVQFQTDISNFLEVEKVLKNFYPGIARRNGL
jgi:hypothetical protein